SIVGMKRDISTILKIFWWCGLTFIANSLLPALRDETTNLSSAEMPAELINATLAKSSTVIGRMAVAVAVASIACAEFVSTLVVMICSTATSPNSSRRMTSLLMGAFLPV